MATYKINGKTYELKFEDTSKTGWPHLHADLVSADGEEIEIYNENLDQYDAGEGDDYVGGGKYIFCIDQYVESDDLMGAPLLSPTEWAVKASDQTVDLIIEERCNFPELDDDRDLIDEVRDYLDREYLALYRHAAECHADSAVKDEAQVAERLIDSCRDSHGESWRFVIQELNNAPVWWANGGERWWDFMSGAKHAEEFVVSADEGARFIRAAAKIPGFASGPEYAPIPFIINPDDDDEEEEADD